jgi:hypothetical protein
MNWHEDSWTITKSLKYRKLLAVQLYPITISLRACSGFYTDYVDKKKIVVIDIF